MALNDTYEWRAFFLAAIVDGDQFFIGLVIRAVVLGKGFRVEEILQSKGSQSISNEKALVKWHLPRP